MPGFGKLKTFAIFCPPAWRSLYGLTSTRFDLEGYLLLPCFPEWVSIDDIYLGAVGYTPTFKRMAYEGARRVQRGYSFNITEGQLGLFYLLERLASLPAVNPYSPNLVKDYVRPEGADYVAALATDTEPFTLRQGAILEPKLQQGLVGTRASKSFEGQGFSFRFQEQIVRDC